VASERDCGIRDPSLGETELDSCSSQEDTGYEQTR
jgi:hypothetical protein